MESMELWQGSIFRYACPSFGPSNFKDKYGWLGGFYILQKRQDQRNLRLLQRGCRGDEKDIQEDEFRVISTNYESSTNIRIFYSLPSIINSVLFFLDTVVNILLHAVERLLIVLGCRGGNIHFRRSFFPFFFNPLCCS